MGGEGRVFLTGPGGASKLLSAKPFLGAPWLIWGMWCSGARGLGGGSCGIVWGGCSKMWAQTFLRGPRASFSDGPWPVQGEKERGRLDPRAASPGFPGPVGRAGASERGSLRCLGPSSLRLAGSPLPWPRPADGGAECLQGLLGFQQVPRPPTAAHLGLLCVKQLR